MTEQKTRANRPARFSLRGDRYASPHYGSHFKENTEKRHGRNTGIKGHRVNIVTVEIGATHIPAGALRIGAKDERSFRGSYQQKEVPLAHLRVAHTVQDCGSGRARLGSGIRGNDRGRLNSFQSCLDFARALITLHRFLCQAPLHDTPQAGGDGRAKPIRNFAHDRGTNLKASAPAKWEAPGSRFVEDNSKCPQIAAMVGRLSTKNLGRHIRQSATYARCVLYRGEGPRRSFEDAATCLFGPTEIKNFDHAFIGDGDIRGLQVPMNNAAVMSAGQSACDLNAIAQD